MQERLNGFKVIKIKLKEDSPEHDLYIKQHSSHQNDNDRPEDRTLYVVNIPPWLSEEVVVKRIFQTVGKIINVFLEQNIDNCGYISAHVVFAKPQDLDKCTKLSKLGSVSTENNLVPMGIEQWTQEYNSNVFSRLDISTRIKSVFAQYNKQTNELKLDEAETTDDGWTIVTKKGRHPGLARKESVEMKLQEKKQKVSNDFYKHQIRLRKQKNIEELREQYEKEKGKVAIMKQKRKFKPY